VFEGFMAHPTVLAQVQAARMGLVAFLREAVDKPAEMAEMAEILAAAAAALPKQRQRHPAQEATGFA
jgi:FixJ family two-component response regulator